MKKHLIFIIALLLVGCGVFESPKPFINSCPSFPIVPQELQIQPCQLQILPTNKPITFEDFLNNDIQNYSCANQYIILENSWKNWYISQQLNWNSNETK